MDLIDLSEQYDPALLERVHRELYLPAFPRPEEREDPSVWAPLLRAPNAAPYHLCFIVARDEHQTPAGFVLAEYYRGSRCALVSYLAVAPAQRRRGVAGALLGKARARLAVLSGGDLRALFAEMHDPRDASEELAASRARLALMRRLGGRRLPLPYRQPALRPGQAHAGALWLLTFPLSTQPLLRLPAAFVEAFLREFFAVLGLANPDRDPDFAPLFAALAAAPGGQLESLPLSDP